ncbi:hypothetical protein IE53DRAFT_320287 [Violaceomyces palustris]|uniref:Uncharacterized protein n=1 Tax=Violaceomyces palustris TaxID=1673888 RepID=A0ACD0NQ48_9BASI|nr:hypothetical protein IE53DRAFT_320287 [Violaceomyces palustris]
MNLIHPPKSSNEPHLLNTYLSLPEPKLVLDLRPLASFSEIHLAHSNHIDTFDQLARRYSSLPPKNLPYLIIASRCQARLVLGKFSSNPLVKFVFLSEQDHDEDQDEAIDGLTCSNPSTSYHTVYCSSSEFFSQAESLDLTRSCRKSGAGQTSVKARFSDPEDVPHLLFRPSKAVERLLDRLELEGSLLPKSKDVQAPLTRMRSFLDVGCGAGRDTAYILDRSRRGKEPITATSVIWRGTAMDSWKAALDRAELLLRDLDLLVGGSGEVDGGVGGGDQAPACEGLVWAKVDDIGALQALEGKGRGKAILGAPPEDAIIRSRNLDFISNHLPETRRNPHSYDLVIMVRFFPRQMMRHLPILVKKGRGSMVMISHFVNATPGERTSQEEAGIIFDYDSPPVEGRIQAGEMEEIVRLWNEDEEPKWKIAEDLVEAIEDGRAVRSLVLARC